MRDKNIFAILHSLRSAHNVGAIFRTADGAGISKIYLTGITPLPYTTEKYKTRAHCDLEKTALGAEKFLKWEYRRSALGIVKKLKSQGVQIIALEQTNRSISYLKCKPKFPLCLIVGNEIDGISKSILNLSDQIIEIPMLGKKKSLNVAVAFGIAIYALRQ